MTEYDIKHFILIYSVPDQEVEIRSFEHDLDAALAEYERLEAEHRDDRDLDIVLLGAESEAVLRRTHGSYFADRPDRLDDLVERELARAAR